MPKHRYDWKELTRLQRCQLTRYLLSLKKNRTATAREIVEEYLDGISITGFNTHTWRYGSHLWTAKVRKFRGLGHVEDPHNRLGLKGIPRPPRRRHAQRRVRR